MTGTKKADLNDSVELSESRIETAVHHIHFILSHVPPLEPVDKESSYEMWSQLGHLQDFSSSPLSLVEAWPLWDSNQRPSTLETKLLSLELSFEAGKLSSNALDEDTNSHISKDSSDVSSNSRILKKIRLKFTKAWLSFLRLPLPLDIYKEVLVTIPQNVFPYMVNPAILCDFLTKSYDIGGVISVMALSGHFVLMTQHGLDYPKFYEKLYELLNPAVFMAKHRAMFFQLLDSCLKSSHLPAYLAAAFAKKLSRLALLVPPQGELVIVALIHNLLRRHPSIIFLVHKEIDEDTNGDASLGGDNSSDDAQIFDASLGGVDPFRNEENDPSKSDATRSSLWEIDSLRHHYCPAVSRFVASLESDLTVRAKTTEVTIADFSSGSYATIFREEMRPGPPCILQSHTKFLVLGVVGFPWVDFWEPRKQHTRSWNQRKCSFENDRGRWWTKRQRLEST